MSDENLDPDKPFDFGRPPETPGEKAALALAVAPYVAATLGGAAVTLGWLFPTSVLGRFFGFGAVSAAGQRLNDSGCASSVPNVMDSARQACPGGDCNILSKQLLREVGGKGEIVSLMPKNGGILPTLPGVASTPWEMHAAVRLPNGSVMDPLLNATYQSLDAWRAAITGNADVYVMIDGAIR